MAHLILLWMVLGITCLAVPMDTARGDEALNAKLEEILEREGLPALGVVVLQGGVVLEAAAVGRRRLDRPTMVSTDDLWHLGSCGKAMTATMIARLVEKGLIDWGTTLKDVFDGVHEDLEDVTLRQLLTHSAGLRANFPLRELIRRPDAEDIQAMRNAAVSAVLGNPPKKPPGMTFLYSNVGYTIAGVMAERVSGEAFETLMRKELFEPLGMTTAGFGAPGIGDDDGQPWGHRHVLGLMRRPVQPSAKADNSPIMAPAGSLHMSLGDWARFVGVHLAGAASGLLSEDTLQELQRPALDDYAFGWIRQQGLGSIEDTTVLWHNGSNTMWYALVALMPAHDTAFLFVTNDGDMKAAERAFFTAGKHLGRRYLPTEILVEP